MPSLPKRVLAVMLVTSVTLNIQLKPAQSNPAALAPALCATGVGCALVGTVVIGGGLYYIWEYQGGKQLAADAAGNVLRMLDDPEDPDSVWEDPLNTKNRAKAEDICKRRAQSLGANYRLRQDPATRLWICVFIGGTGR